LLNLKAISRTLKRLPLHAILGRWNRKSEFEQGYTIILPSPMDMPFMLRLGIEGLKHLDTANCRQILVVPDGLGGDGGAGLKSVLREFDDPRLEFVDLSGLQYWLVRRFKPLGGALTHWMMVLNGTMKAKCEYAFLHDADAFFLESDGLERQYREASSKRMHTYGVEARWDPFYTSLHYSIPGTWELMYSTRWARSRSPMYLKPGVLQTPHGEHGFDSTHYAQYLDYQTGKIGVMEKPPQFVHFNGTIFTYRTFRDSNGEPVTDDLFRVLLLSLIEAALDLKKSSRTVPSLDVLERGLCDPTAIVRYDSEVNRRGYAEFRNMVEKLCLSPTFVGERADCIRQSILPFDRHFSYQPGESFLPALETGDVRISGISEGVN
jgi:hypothetical protein